MRTAPATSPRCKVRVCSLQTGPRRSLITGTGIESSCRGECPCARPFCGVGFARRGQTKRMPTNRLAFDCEARASARRSIKAWGSQSRSGLHDTMGKCKACVCECQIKSRPCKQHVATQISRTSPARSRSRAPSQRLSLSPPGPERPPFTPRSALRPWPPSACKPPTSSCPHRGAPPGVPRSPCVRLDRSPCRGAR